MRKKISALCFILVAALCMSVANAQFTYKWEVQTGTDAEGAEIWAEVTDPIGAGITINALTKMRVTVDGATKVTTNSIKYVYLYQSDLETKQMTSQFNGKVSGTTVTYDIASAYSTPDKPYTVEGTYCLIIPEQGLNLTDAEGNATKSDSVLGCMVTVDNDYFITKDNCSIDRTETWFKSFPTQFTITINDDRVTKTALTEKATVGVYSGKTLKTNADVTVSEDGKTLTLNLQNEITGSGSSFYVAILEGSLMFNDDATKTNNHLMFGPYTLPSSTNPRDIVPAKGGKVSSLDKFYVYAGVKSGTFIFDEEKPAYLSFYNEETAAYEKVCDLKAVQVEDPMSVIGQEYITIEYSPASTPEGGFALGMYQISIPEKSWFYERLSGTTLSVNYIKAYTAEYELAVAPEINTTPVWSIENGSTQKDLETLTVTFAGATTAKYNSSKPAQLYKKIGSNYSHLSNVNYEGISYSSYAPVGEGGVVTMKFDKLSQEGEYKIVLPEGGLTFDGFPDITNAASEITFSIESSALVKPSNVTISPATGVISSLPETFTITLNNTEITSVEVGTQEVLVGWDDDYNDIYEQKALQATFNEVDGYGSVLYDITVDAADCKKITFTKTADRTMTLDATKQYFFQVPAGALIINKNAETGEYSENDEINFGMYEKFAIEVTPSVDDVIYSVKDFVITANTPVLTYAGNEENPVIINYIDPEFGMISPMTATVNAVEGVANQFVISLEMEAKQPGEYTLYVPAGTFLYNGDVNTPVDEINSVYEVVAEPIDEGVTTVPAQGDLDIEMVGGTFRSVNVIFPEDVKRNPDFKGEITLAINGTIVSSVEKLSAGELPTELGIVFPDKFTLNGTYTVTMPRGAAIYVADGRESSSQVFTWNVTGGFTPGEGVTVDPAEGVVESLSLISLTFNEHEIATKNVWYNSSALATNGNVILRDASGSIVAECTTNEMSPSELGYNSVEIQLCEPGTATAVEITEPGIYTLTVPAGLINFNKNGTNPCTCGECLACTTSRAGVGNGNYNEELSFTWTILGDATLVATPADGSVVESLVNIVLDWEDAATVTVDANLMVGGAKLYKVVEGAENEFVSDMICSPVGEGSTTAVIDILNPVAEDGVYVVEIAEGMFTVDGKVWEAVTLTYTIARTEVTLEETGDAPLAKLLMTVSPCESIEVNPETADVITLWYTTSSEQRMGEYAVENITASTAELVLEATEDLKDGNYVVWIPEGYFLFNGKPCADIKIYFDNVVINSIYGISLDAQDLNIYSVNGMLIKRNGSISDLNELEPGIYIINGKKVMVK